MTILGKVFEFIIFYCLFAYLFFLSTAMVCKKQQELQIPVKIASLIIVKESLRPAFPRSMFAVF